MYFRVTKLTLQRTHETHAQADSTGTGTETKGARDRVTLRVQTSQQELESENVLSKGSTHEHVSRANIQEREEAIWGQRSEYLTHIYHKD